MTGWTILVVLTVATPGVVSHYLPKAV